MSSGSGLLPEGWERGYDFSETPSGELNMEDGPMEAAVRTHPVYYHGTSEDLRPGDIVPARHSGPSLGERPHVWVSSSPQDAAEYARDASPHSSQPALFNPVYTVAPVEDETGDTEIGVNPTSNPNYRAFREPVKVTGVHSYVPSEAALPPKGK